MVQMRNDFLRRASFDAATKEAAKDNFNYHMHQTMEERLATMRAKQMRPKRKIPWFTIITVVTTIPFLMNGGLSDLVKQTKTVSGQQINEAISTMEAHSPNENAIVSIQIGDRTIQREVSIEDLRALQGE